MERLPKDVLIELALNLSLPEILNFCRTSRRHHEVVCENNDFWNKKLAMDFNVSGRKDAKRFYEHLYSILTKPINTWLDNEYKAVRKFMDINRIKQEFLKDLLSIINKLNVEERNFIIKEGYLEDMEPIDEFFYKYYPDLTRTFGYSIDAMDTLEIPKYDLMAQIQKYLIAIST